MQKRRTFIASLATLAAANSLAGLPGERSQKGKPDHIACNQYPWFTFYERKGLDWSANLDKSLGEFAASGIRGYEPLVNNAQEIEVLAPLLKKHRLKIDSLYVNSVLHKTDEAQSSIEQVLSIAAAARPLGTKIIVTNPSPIQWGGKEDKSDAQLDVQAVSINSLGAKLKSKGITLAYHNHDIEMRRSAREFHHMMVATDPANVSLCLDVHWVYRGAGNSQVALFDIVKLYGNRIAELHLRQSKEGIWTETFGDGDIDYAKLVRELLKRKIQPHLVLEQCVERETPDTMDAVTAHRQNMAYATKLFSAMVDQ